MQAKEKTNANTANSNQPTIAGKPVLGADLTSRNALNPPMTGATRKVAVVKKYANKLACAKAGNSRSPELLSMAPAIRNPHTRTIQATIAKASNKSWL